MRTGSTCGRAARKLLACVAIGLTLVVAPAMRAQQSGIVVGTVTDKSSGQPMPQSAPVVAGDSVVVNFVLEETAVTLNAVVTTGTGGAGCEARGRRGRCRRDQRARST
jgi:hypothetical protein